MLRWKILDDDGVVHAVTTRAGGVSPAPWDTLNLSWARPDPAENVRENRRRVCTALEITPERMVQAGQVHGVGVRIVDVADAGCGASERSTLLAPADALITDAREVYLLACFADCVPLLFYDPRRPAVGIAHAGWRGTVAGMGEATVRAMAEAYGSRPGDLRVVIGPAAGPCCYEVGDEVIAAVEQRFSGAKQRLSGRTNGRAHLDLWEANRITLLAAGVAPEHIETSGICTIHHADRFFSHRASGGETGRFGAIIGVRGGGEARMLQGGG